MGILSEQERDGLEDVFLSISSGRFLPLKWSLSYWSSYWALHLKEPLKGISRDRLPFEKNKNTPKWTIFQKNCQKAEKHR